MTNLIRPATKNLIQLERLKNRRFLPVLITDIDGVLVRGGNPIPGTLQALRLIQQQQIPFACLTNGGGQLQSTKARKMNDIFGENLFHGDSMFMNHTPLKPRLLQYNQKEGNLLITGSLNIKSIVDGLNIRNYITAHELYNVYFNSPFSPHTPVFEGEDYTLHERNVAGNKEEVERRLGRQLGTFEQEAANINSIFALNDVSPYEISLRVIHNVLKVKSNAPLQYFASQNDILWASGYPKPRMAFGPFNYILENHCHKHNFHHLEHIYYGKPQKKAFKYVEDVMRKRQPEGVFFMVGDNPRADIRGANQAGWYSFLTKTGIHSSPENDPNDPATFFVENFQQAVLTILEAKQELDKLKVSTI